MLMYWVNPSDRHDPVRHLGLKPVMALKSRVMFIKSVVKGTSISYGREYVSPSKKIIATIACGYADGYPWNISRDAHVLIRGKKAPLTGRVCMDQLMVDATSITGVKKEDEAVLIGQSGDKMIRAEQVAAWGQTIPYQITTCLAAHVPRVYKPGQ
jgi:alanine racemase